MVKIVDTIIHGVALASLWFWAFTIYNRVCEPRLIRLWLQIIVPQGVVIAFVLRAQGWL
jgi:hypothetical protein